MTEQRKPNDAGAADASSLMLPVFNERYELRRSIGRNSISDTYLAHDRLLDRPVVFKALLPELTTDKAFVQAFRLQAQAAANLSHASIATVLDWGRDLQGLGTEPGPTYYLITEFVDAPNLEELVRRSGPLPADQACNIAVEITTALGFAHRSGVVHGQLKPADVFVTPSGVRVTDFGLDYALGPGWQPGDDWPEFAHWRAPELVRGDEPDPRTDVYALGLVLYFMVTGRLPFPGESADLVARRHLEVIPPAPSKLNSTVPRPFETIVGRSMAKNPDDRFASINDQRAALVRFRDQFARQGGARPAPPGSAGAPASSVPSGAAGSPASSVPPRATEATAPTEAVSDSAMMAVARPVAPDTPSEPSAASTPAPAAPTGDDTSVIDMRALLDEQPPLSETAPPAASTGPIDERAIDEHALDEVMAERWAASTSGVMTEGPAGDDPDKTARREAHHARGDHRPVGGEAAVRAPKRPGQNKPGASKPGAKRPPADPAGAARRPARGPGDLPAKDTAKRSAKGPGKGASRPTGTGDETQYLRRPDARPRRTWPYVIVLLALLALLAYLVMALLHQIGYGDGGGSTVAVPSVVGRTVEDAEATLETAGLVARREPPVANADVPAGNVIKQTPPPGTKLGEGGTVTLIVSSGPGVPTVPDVIGQTLDVARSALAAAGFPIEVTEQETDEKDPGTIMSQDPLGGTTVAAITPIKVVVAKSSGKVVVPEVAGKSVEEATIAMTQSGFRSAPQKEVSATVPADQVTRTEPAAGTKLDKGASVIIFVSLGPTAPVPSVIGLPEGEATATLTAAGYTVDRQVKATSEPTEAGRVLGQTPSAGKGLAPGSPVTIRVGELTAPTTRERPTTTEEATTETVPVEIVPDATVDAGAEATAAPTSAPATEPPATAAPEATAAPTSAPG